MSEHQTVEMPNEKSTVEVSRKQLPLHCPTPEMSLWNSHPRVFLSIEETGQVTCPYCGTAFSLKNE
ncbi:MAG: zinc-finger domain-containing protein [Proteobacteria bacterium]|nr:zinc-finger domain-containing protein [Pseudomonadota bacterium]